MNVGPTSAVPSLKSSFFFPGQRKTLPVSAPLSPRKTSFFSPISYFFSEDYCCVSSDPAPPLFLFTYPPPGLPNLVPPDPYCSILDPPRHLSYLFSLFFFPLLVYYFPYPPYGHHHTHVFSSTPLLSPRLHKPSPRRSPFFLLAEPPCPLTIRAAIFPIVVSLDTLLRHLLICSPGLN